MVQNSITDWISSLSAFGAMVIAGVTAYLAYKQYLQPLSQESEPDLATDEEASSDNSTLVVFDTSKQRTELRVGDRGLECWLLNKQKGENTHQWTLEDSEVKSILSNNDFVVNPGYKVRTGLFSLGRRRNWLYSKKLFPQPEYLHGQLRELLKAVEVA